jgi:hypothetical protein
MVNNSIMLKISEPELRKKVGTRFFGVKFVKRTNNKVRTMSCRLGVYPERKPKFQRSLTNPADHGLIKVWCADAKNYRSVPLDNIISLTIDGKRYD